VNIAQPESYVKSLVFVLYTLTAFVIVASFLFVHLMGFGFFFYTPGGLELSMRSFEFPILILFLVGFSTPALRVGAVFSFVWIVYGLCFLVAWKWRRSFSTTVQRSSSVELSSISSNFLLAMPLLSSMVLTSALAIIYSQSAVGIETGAPQLPSDAHEAFLNLAYAPLIEEIGFRLVPIGLVMVFYVFLSGKNVKAFSTAGSRVKLLFLSFIYPEGAKKLTGLPNVGEHGVLKGMSPIEWTMIAATSVVFGLAHVFSPVGWEIGKITSTFVQGFFFAVTYIAYGFEAPILMHWYFNYYFYFFDPNVAEKFFPATVGLLSVVELMILVVGVLGWVAIVIGGLRRAVGRTRRKYAQPPLPPSFSYPSQSV